MMNWHFTCPALSTTQTACDAAAQSIPVKNAAAGTAADKERDNETPQAGSDNPARRLAAGPSLTGALRRVLLLPVCSPARAGGGSVMLALNEQRRRAVTPALTGPNNEHLVSARQEEGAPVTTTAPGLTPAPAVLSGADGDQHSRLTGIALMCASGLSCQFGAATATLAFPALGPAAWHPAVGGRRDPADGRPPEIQDLYPGAVVAGALAGGRVRHHEPVALHRDRPRRPRPRGRVGVSGPARRRAARLRPAIDLACVLVAGAAVVVVARPQPTTDYAGIGLGLLAASCWAAYILLNRIIGRRLPGAQGPAAAAGLSALLYVPVGIWVLSSHALAYRAVGYAAVAGVLSSAVPFLADVLALKRVPAGFFGVFMSVNPVLAALIGLILLGQALQWQAVDAGGVGAGWLDKTSKGGFGVRQQLLGERPKTLRRLSTVWMSPNSLPAQSNRERSAGELVMRSRGRRFGSGCNAARRACRPRRRGRTPCGPCDGLHLFAVGAVDVKRAKVEILGWAHRGLVVGREDISRQP